MAISNMQQPRQMYGLGSFVKKFTRPIKKVFKSPIGKAALLAGGAYMLGGGRFGLGAGDGFSMSNLNPFEKGKTNFLRNMFLKKGAKAGGDLSYGKLGLGVLGLGATTLPFLGGEEDEGEIVDPFSTTPSSITDIVSMAKAKDPSLRFMPNSQYVQKNFYAPKADGGVVGLANGGGGGGGGNDCSPASRTAGLGGSGIVIIRYKAR